MSKLMPDGQLRQWETSQDDENVEISRITDSTGVGRRRFGLPAAWGGSKDNKSTVVSMCILVYA